MTLLTARSRTSTPQTAVRLLVALAWLTAGFLALFVFTGCTLVSDGIDKAQEFNQDIEEITQPGAGDDAQTHPASIESTVIRVVDGDTIVVRSAAPALADNTDTPGEHTVRLLSIDSPEMHFDGSAAPDCGAVAATENLKQLLPVDTAVALTYDPVADRTDRFGRSLAFVSIAAGSEAGLDVNAEQVAAGLADAWVPPSEPTPERFADYERAAHTARTEALGSYGAPEHCATLGRG